MNLFNIIKNDQKYWLVDQVKQDGASEEIYKEHFDHILTKWKEGNIGYLSLLMTEDYHDWLIANGLRQVSKTVEYTRDITNLPQVNSDIQWHALSEQLISDAAYGNLYERSSAGSANKNAPQKKEQFLDSLKRELGEQWREHCLYFINDRDYAGIAIPHIEMGTMDEGRLFYFGVVPEWRGKGMGSAIHKIALTLLRKWNATTYVGSTGSENEPMIRIFEQNGCMLLEEKGMYHIESRYI